VVAVVVLRPPENVPLGPLVGAANATEIPLTGLPFASVTRACSAVANAVFVLALCGVPALAVTNAGMLAIVVVSVAFAGDAPPPDTLAWFTCGEVALFATLTVTVMAE
jgi:hypothetical protein